MKNTFVLPQLKRGLMAILLITLVFGALTAIFVWGREIMASEAIDQNIKFVWIPMLIAIPLFVLLRPLYMKKVTARFGDDGMLRITKASGYPIFERPLWQVHTMFISDNDQALSVKLYDSAGKELFMVMCNILASKKQRTATKEFFKELITRTGAVRGETIKGNKFKNPGIYFHSTLQPGQGGRMGETVATESVKRKIQSKKRRNAVIGVAAFLVVVVGVFGLGAMQKSFYEIAEDGTVTYGSKVVDTDADQFETLTYKTAKDSSTVFFCGVPQPDIDARTLREINMFIVMDTNGIYREPTFTLFSGKRLKRLEGIDHDSFRALASDLFADKDHVFYIDPFASNPVVAVKTDPAPDPASAQAVGSHFFKDEKGVWFCPMGGLMPKYCPELDAASFEDVSWEVYKDRNHVYFITFMLDQKGGNENTGYDILRGADAATFRMTDYPNFEDKNKEWTIERHQP